MEEYLIKWCEKKNEDWIVATLVVNGSDVTDVSINRKDKKTGKDFPGFDEHLKRFHDWDVWLTLAARGKNGVFLKKNLFHVIVHGPSRIGSAWLPRVAYRIPWKKLGFVPKRIQSYERAREAICEKHHSA